MTDHSSKLKSIFQILSLVLVFASTVAMDQASKTHAEKSLMVHTDPVNPRDYQGRPYPIWASSADPADHSKHDLYFSFSFNYVRNLGAAWGMFSNVDDKYRIPFFHLVTLAATLAIGFLFVRTPAKDWISRLAYILILSGAIGNYIDRIARGYVVDWIDVRWNIFGWQYYYPNFNLADIAIFMGVSILVIAGVIEQKRNRASSRKSPAAG